MYKKLTANRIPCKFICDSAIGTAMSEADVVLTGAEAVVESGGIINRVTKKHTKTMIFCSIIISKNCFVCLTCKGWNIHSCIVC